MTQTKKNIAVLKKWLKENGVDYVENTKVRGVDMDIYIPKYWIAIHIGDDDAFFKATRGRFAPFFIRETESEAKTVEKITNCCIMQMQQFQRQFNSKKYGKKK